MVQLSDIAPLAEEVPVGGGQTAAVYGVSVLGIVDLIHKYPELQALLSGEAIGTEALLSFGPKAVAAIIAAGCGQPGDEKAEAVAAKFPVAIQADLLEAILRLTMPAGIGPFVEKLVGLRAVLGGPLGVDSPTKARDTK